MAIAPVRVDFTGGYTDVAPYADQRRSTVVNAAVTRFARVTATAREDGLCLVEREGQPVTQFGLAQPETAPRDLVSVAASAHAPPGGVSLDVHLDVPSRSGLGSSGAVGVAVTRALMALNGEEALPQAVAESAAASERNAGIAGGKQDQYAAAFGGVRAIMFNPGMPPVVESIGGSAQTVLEAGVIAHSGGGRESSVLVAETMGAYIAGVRDVVRALDGLSSVASDIRSALIRGQVDRLGESLNEVRRLQCQLGDQIREAIDGSPFTKLINQGHCWGKPLGGAGPGAAWFLLPRNHTAEQLAHRIRNDGFECWRCSAASGVSLERTDI